MPRLARPVIGPISNQGHYGMRTLLDRYGRPYQNFHNGLDFSWLYADVAGSTKVVSAHPGVVSDVGYSAAAGYYVTVRLDSRWLVRYIHLEGGTVRVKVGDKVGYGTHIATMGSSGTTARHLHFDLFDLTQTDSEKRVDPAPYLVLPYPTTVEWASAPATTPLQGKATEMHLIRTGDGKVFLVTSNGMAHITSPNHLALVERVLNSGPGSYASMSEAERVIVRTIIHAANTSDDAETAKLLQALGQVKATVDTAAIVGAVERAIAAQGVEVDFAPILAAIAQVNENIDDQPTQFEITPKG